MYEILSDVFPQTKILALPLYIYIYNLVDVIVSHVYKIQKLQLNYTKEKAG